MEDPDPAPEQFRAAVASLGSVLPRPEVRLTPVRPPQRLAPWSSAWSGRVGGDGEGEDPAAGRLVLLHDPDGHEAWDGTLRLVGFVRAALDADIAADPLLPEVAWSWLADALLACEAAHTALGGTVTRTASVRFGDMAGPEGSDEVELRASWTPLGTDLRAHAAAFCTLLAIAAGLPPAGVAALGSAG